MIIGLDASRAVTAQRTGTEHYTLYLVRALVRAGPQHQFRLYFNQAPPDGLFERSERVTWRVIPFPRLWTHLGLATELALRPPDVLFVPAHVVPIIHPRRCVATIHDLGYLHYPEAHTWRSRRYLDWSTRHNLRVCDQLIVDSEATRHDLVQAYQAQDNRLVTAYPAGVEGLAHVPAGPAREAVQQRHGLGQRYYLYLGTLQPRKNLLRLLDAFEQLVKQERIGPEVQLALAGRHGWLYDQIVARSNQGLLQGRVVLPGYLPSEDVAPVMSGALAFVMPSLWEGFGLPVLEAMACETPVICSNVSSLPEVAGDAALLVDPYDIAGLADAMHRMATDQALRQTLVSKGLRQLTQFSWERCARIVLDTLERVARGHS